MASQNTTSSRWVDEFEEKLTFAVAGTSQQYIPRLLQKQELKEEGLEAYLFTGYHLGREYSSVQLMEASTTFLRTRIPDVQQRLPFYEVMFDIMDKGEFRQSAGLLSYGLSDCLFQQLSARLYNQTKHPQWLVRKLSRELAFVPGQQFNVVYGEIKDRPERIALIADHLHRPMKNMMTVLEEQSSAAVHYNHLLSRGHINPTADVNPTEVKQ